MDSTVGEIACTREQFGSAKRQACHLALPIYLVCAGLKYILASVDHVELVQCFPLFWNAFLISGNVNVNFFHFG
jgi:hypothetical protein